MIRSKSFVSDLSSQIVEEFVLSKAHYINIVIAYFFMEYHFIFGNLYYIHDVQMVQFNFIEYHVIFGNLCCIYDIQFNGIKVPRITLSFNTFHYSWILDNTAEILQQIVASCNPIMR